MSTQTILISETTAAIVPRERVTQHQTADGKVWFSVDATEREYRDWIVDDLVKRGLWNDSPTD